MKSDFAWIEHIPYDEAGPKLKKLYNRVISPEGKIDNIMQIHSLRPHSMAGHMALYKSVLHHAANTLPKWLLETCGVYTSILNACNYCVDHHFSGLKRLLNDDERANVMKEALESGELSTAFSKKEKAILDYTRELTLNLQGMQEIGLEPMRAAGLNDGEILEINQVVSYFNYANRTVIGLGVSTKGDILGLSPNESDDPDNWQHK